MTTVQIIMLWDPRKHTHLGGGIPHESSAMRSHQWEVLSMGSCFIGGTSRDSTGTFIVLNLYINDITEDISSELCLFAIDCMLYRVIRFTCDCEQLLQYLNRLDK